MARSRLNQAFLFLVIAGFLILLGCSEEAPDEPEWRIIDAKPGDYGIFLTEIGKDYVTQIYGSDKPISGASVSPDGLHIVFTEKTSGDPWDFDSSEIVLLNSDGSDRRYLTENEFMDEAPSWTPDGKIVFVSTMGDVRGTDIYIMDTNGDILERLTDTPDTSESDPDVGNTKIVFTRDYRIWVMERDGSNPHPVTDPPNAGTPVIDNYPVGDYDPELSPDEKEVAFERMQGLGGQEFNGYEIPDMDIFVLDLDEDQPTELSFNSSVDALPKWSYDGSWILFVHVSANIWDIFDIFVMEPDGSGRTKASGNDPLDFVETSADWLPGSKERIVFTAQLGFPEEGGGSDGQVRPLSRRLFIVERR